jgi:hypothetical protein
VIYAVGRIKDQPKVSHLGIDLIEALAMSEALTQTLRFTTRRERPDGSGKTAFPSGHAADTLPSTALERHLNWRNSVPAYTFASYVAISRLPANRHWLSDTVFGSAVGIIAGRTVTSPEAERPFPVQSPSCRVEWRSCRCGPNELVFESCAMSMKPLCGSQATSMAYAWSVTLRSDEASNALPFAVRCRGYEGLCGAGAKRSRRFSTERSDGFP